MGTYLNILTSSDEYVNLVKAKEEMISIQDSFETLELVITSNTSGNVVSEYQEKITEIKNKISNYITRIENIINKLTENANLGDSTLESWNGRIGGNFIEPSSRTISDDDGTVSTYKTYHKIDAVGLDSNNVIQVTIHQYTDISSENTTTTPPTSSFNTSDEGNYYAKYNFSGEQIS